ncbi:hypothetical protein [Mesorhizobium sp. B2-4-19]|uniref:hypothetical protein n=1 Tax=Mesorhizobium sp. B2-4-19 TaxID=2589930 RepID=UPI0015E33F71|nr:hypothetical protein [Mesorhizobium sp. B2-4-19]
MVGFLAAAGSRIRGTAKTPAGSVGSLCIVTRYKFKLVSHQNRLSLWPEWNKCLE